ncbi:6-bladed beta-propeller [Echinicola marina]|uniref:6-bladed beta-propeller n=1 Tax=Echinicola marina TaxID=2859768 RepID=UPI001CF680DD|nr:6-bladed beta-propeller [Echinicola marina]UCS92438.1 6-bladed beta-propeller [Echinicola marina]
MKIFSLISLVLFISSCNNNPIGNKIINTENIIDITVDPSNSKNVKPSTIFNSVEFLTFKNEENIISNINKVNVAGDNLIFESDNVVFRSNLNENRALMIGRPGNGPGEYISVNDLYIDKQDSTINILDGKSGKIIIYNYEGEFIEEFRNPNFTTAIGFTKLDNNNFAIYGGAAFYGGLDYRCFLWSADNKKIIGKFFPIGDEHKYDFFIDANNFWDDGNNILFSYSFKDTIYNMEKDKIVPKYAINFGDFTLPQEIRENNYEDVVEFVTRLRESNYAYQATNFYNLDKYLYFTFQYKSNRFRSFYNKHNQKTVIVSKIGTKENNFIEDELYYFSKIVIGSNDNFLFCQVDPYEFVSIYDGIKENLNEEEWTMYMKGNPELEKLYKLFKSEDPGNVILKLEINTELI